MSLLLAGSLLDISLFLVEGYDRHALAAIATIERADQMIGSARPDIVGADEAQSLAAPSELAVEIGRYHQAVAAALPMMVWPGAIEIAAAAIFSVPQLTIDAFAGGGSTFLRLQTTSI